MDQLQTRAAMQDGRQCIGLTQYGEFEVVILCAWNVECRAAWQALASCAYAPAVIEDENGYGGTTGYRFFNSCLARVTQSGVAGHADDVQ
jgi:hypothetical protein